MIKIDKNNLVEGKVYAGIPVGDVVATMIFRFAGLVPVEDTTNNIEQLYTHSQVVVGIGIDYHDSIPLVVDVEFIEISEDNYRWVEENYGMIWDGKSLVSDPSQHR